MASVRALAALSLVLPVGLAACEKSSRPIAPISAEPFKTPRTPQQLGPRAVTTTAPEAEPLVMVPASRVDESADYRPGTASEMLDTAPLTDGQIVALTDAANAAEIAKAKLALEKARSERVSLYAQAILDHHSKAKREQSTLAASLKLAPSESPRLGELRTDTLETLRTLEAAPAEIFDKVYVDVEIADQRRFLDSLDRGLIPSADNADLKLSLEALRPMIQAHHRAARELGRALE